MCLRSFVWNTVRFVIAESEHNSKTSFPPNVMTLPSIYSYTLDFYNSYTMRIVSVLKSLEHIHRENLDEIIVSTPGCAGSIPYWIRCMCWIKIP